MPMNIRNTLNFLTVDYCNEKQLGDLLGLLQHYAKDPMGGGQAIPRDVIEALPNALRQRAFMHSFLVYKDDQAVAFANCIESFSTFSGKGVLNIHDFAVLEHMRGQELSQFLLTGIQKAAKLLGCTKLTLEVLQGNTSAVRAYEKSGFRPYQLAPELGYALFYQKYIA